MTLAHLLVGFWGLACFLTGVAIEELGSRRGRRRLRRREPVRVDGSAVVRELGHLAGTELPAAVNEVRRLGVANDELSRRAQDAERQRDVLVAIAATEMTDTGG